jgi:hypothetical protein
MTANRFAMFYPLLIPVTQLACRDGMPNTPFKEARLSMLPSGPCQIKQISRLRGGKDTGIPEVEDEKYAQREALWQKWREEWEYCTGTGNLDFPLFKSPLTLSK